MTIKELYELAKERGIENVEDELLSSDVELVVDAIENREYVLAMRKLTKWAESQQPSLETHNISQDAIRHYLTEWTCRLLDGQKVGKK